MASILISLDLEGVACVVGEANKTLTDSKDYQFACIQAVHEVNAAIGGLCTAGADRIDVWDSHDKSLNIDYSAIDSRARVVAGNRESRRFSFAEGNYDAAIFIGYHAMEGDPVGVLAHSYSSVEFQQIRVNGSPVGEISCDAAMLGESGIPVLMVVSDDRGCLEAHGRLPDVSTIETKQSISRNMAISKHPDAVVEEIERMCAGLVLSDRPSPLRWEPPITIELEYKRSDDAETKARRDVRFERVEAHTVRAVVDSLSTVF